MSLLLEALKKAEKAKEEAQRQPGKPSNAESGLRLEMEAPPPAKHVLTKDELPSIAAGIEITSDDLGVAPPPPPPAPRPESSAPSSAPAAPSRQASAASAAAPESRAAARKVFEAKFKEPNPRLPFYFVVGALGIFAAGTVGYFWYQLRPAPPLFNPSPQRNPAEPAAAVPASPPAPSPTTTAAAPNPDTPGLAQAAGSPAPAAAVAVATPPPAAAGPSPAAATASAGAPARAPETAAAATAADRDARRTTPTDPPATAPARGARAPVASRKPAASIDPLVEAGYQAYQTGDLPAARASYERALAADAANRDALLGLAAVESRALNPAAAESLYRRVLRADPREPHALAGLLSLRPESQDPVATESRIRTLLANDPESAALQFALGSQYAQQARWPEAQQWFFKAFATEPENPDFAYNLAVSLDHLRQPRLALDYYQRALSLAAKRGAAFDRAAAQDRIRALAR